MPLKRSGTIYSYNSHFLTEPQIAVFSEMLRNLALLLTGSTIIPYFFDFSDKPKFSMVLLSVVIIGILLIVSLKLIRNNKIL